MKNIINCIKNKIEMFILERQERRLHIKMIKKLVDESSTRYSDDMSSKLFYIEEALKKAAIRRAEEYEDDDGDDEDGSPIIRRFYGCPTCHEIIYQSQNYCSHCGQRLKFWR